MAKALAATTGIPYTNATAPTAPAEAPVPHRARHEFSGIKVRVEILKTSDQEPRDVFVGLNDYQAVIKRGTTVELPIEVFQSCIAEAKYTAKEIPDESQPEIFEWVEKQRYPYNMLGIIQPAAAEQIAA